VLIAALRSPGFREVRPASRVAPRRTRGSRRSPSSSRPEIENRFALFSSFGAIGVGAPLILLAGAAVVVRTARGRGVAFVALTASFAVLTLNQVRFGRIGVPLLMIHTSALFSAFAQRRRTTQHLWAVRVFPALAALVLIWADPVIRPSPSSVRGSGVHRRGAGPGVQAGGDSRSGVLTPWHLGHLVSYASGLPTATNGFGTYLDENVFREAEAAFHGSADALDAFLDRRRLRFVIAGGMESPLVGAVPERRPFVRIPEARRAILDLGTRRSEQLLVIGVSGSQARTFATSSTSCRSSRRGGRSLRWVLARRSGSTGGSWGRVSGTARPGARVLAALDFRGKDVPRRAFADTGTDSRFEMVIPLPSGLVRATLSPAPVNIPDRRWPAPCGVPEAAVQAGAAIRVGAIEAARAMTPSPDTATPRSRRVTRIVTGSPVAVEGQEETADIRRSPTGLRGIHVASILLSLPANVRRTRSRQASVTSSYRARASVTCQEQ
jgi:hypothetical protein